MNRKIDSQISNPCWFLIEHARLYFCMGFNNATLNNFQAFAVTYKIHKTIWQCNSSDKNTSTLIEFWDEPHRLTKSHYLYSSRPIFKPYSDFSGKMFLRSILISVVGVFHTKTVWVNSSRKCRFYFSTVNMRICI